VNHIFSEENLMLGLNTFSSNDDVDANVFFWSKDTIKIKPSIFLTGRSNGTKVKFDATLYKFVDMSYNLGEPKSGALGASRLVEPKSGALGASKNEVVVGRVVNENGF
jgi:hypothetical protein